MSVTVTVVGSLNVDRVAVVDRLPRRGETVAAAGELRIVPGGKGANQAVAASRLGARVRLVGRVGDDDDGRSLLRSVVRAGVDARGVALTPGTATGAALVVVGPGGENVIVVSGGANACLGAADVDRNAAALASDALLVQLEAPLVAAARAADIGHDVGAVVVLNAAPVGPLLSASPADRRRLLSSVDVLVVNETEAAALHGADALDFGALSDTAEALCAHGPTAVALTLGARGAYVWSSGNGELVPARPSRVVDTTGAGDAFAAALAVGLAEGRRLADAARFGCAAGAIACSALGAQPSFPDRTTVDTFLSS